ncbi:MAG: PEGA domain-containing protein [Polyangiaceae bacterium]
MTRRHYSAQAKAPRLRPLGSWALSAFMLGCFPAQSPVQRTVSLRIQGFTPEAAVMIDEEALGTLAFVATHGVALPPGVHHLTVQAPGYFPWDRTVEAKLGSPLIRLNVILTPVPD